MVPMTDMVINIGALKSKNLALVEEDIQAVVEASGYAGQKSSLRLVSYQMMKRLSLLAKLLLRHWRRLCGRLQLH